MQCHVSTCFVGSAITGSLTKSIFWPKYVHHFTCLNTKLSWESQLHARRICSKPESGFPMKTQRRGIKSAGAETIFGQNTFDQHCTIIRVEVLYISSDPEASNGHFVRYFGIVLDMTRDLMKPSGLQHRHQPFSVRHMSGALVARSRKASN